MVISESGLICLESSENRLVREFVSLWFGPRPSDPSTPRATDWPSLLSVAPALSAPAAAVVPAANDDAAPVSGAGPGLDEEAGVRDPLPDDDVTPLTAQERRARAAALRGLLLARQRRFGPAQAAFADAVKLDPQLELEAVPTFWNLERSAHEAAVRAYEDAGRKRDAGMLASRLRTTFRPRLVRPRSSPSSTAG